MAVDVTQRVTGEVTNLTVMRDGDKMKASWAIPSYMTDEERADRAQFLDSIMRFGSTDLVSGEVWSTGSGSAYPGPPEKTLDYTGYDEYWVKGLALNTSYEKPYDRNRYYPLSGKRVKSVLVSVHGGNGSGVGGSDAHSLTALGRGPSALASYVFKQPREPKVSIAYNNGTKVATVTVETDEGRDECERWDTKIQAWVTRQDGKQVTVLPVTYTRLAKWTWTIDLTQYVNSIAPGKAVSVACFATARGMWGDSSTGSHELWVSYPKATTIRSVTSAGKAQGSQIAVKFDQVNDSDATVQLQRRVGESGAFSDVSGAVDNGGKLTALYDVYGNVNPPIGDYTYYRIKITRDNYVNYSNVARADDIYTAKPPKVCPADVGIPIIRVPNTVNQQGKGNVTVVLGWTDKFTESDASKRGCELTIGETPDAWLSSDGVKTYDLPDSQSPGPDASRASTAYNKTRTTTFAATQGVTYYAKMRRWRIMEGEKVYSSYSKTVSFRIADASTAKVGIASVTPGKDGTTASVVIGINEAVEGLGTNVSFSTLPDAWKSNKVPQPFKANWSRYSYGQQGWTYAQDVSLYELNPSTTYFIRAQRYSSGAEGNMSPVYSFTTPSAPTASSDSWCNILSCEGGVDGKSAKVVIGYDGNRTGCEVTWSDDPNAWESSKQPSSMNATWTDAENQSGYVLTTDTEVIESKTYYTRSGSGTEQDPYVYTEVASPSTSALSTYYEREWAATCTVYLSDLAEGATYYVRARTYHDGDSTTYSEYGETAIVTPISAPSQVVLTAPSAIARGETIDAYWTVGSDIDQAEWHVHPIDESQEGDARKMRNVSLANGEGSLCRAIIPPERYGDAESVTFYVSAGCGGGLTDSNEVSVGIADVPACEVCCPPVLTAQPATFEAYTDDPSCTLLATCYSRGITIAAPDGNRDQRDGDAVWTDSLAPAWELATWGDTALISELEAALEAAEDALEDTDPTDEVAYANAEHAVEVAQAALDAHPAAGEVYMTEVTLPTCELADTGEYRIEAKAVERVAGLASEPAEARFSVAWAHQAPVPEAVELTVDVEKRTVNIEFTPSNGAIAGDCYDLYRQTPTGHVLVASGLALDTEALDAYAPFGDRHYRVACRTVDGDFAFADFGYSLPANVLRFDFDGEAVELPLDLKLTDSYTKDHDVRKHSNGSIGGYYEPAISRSGSYSTDVCRFTEPEQIRKVRLLGEHAGACFCRTAEGMAFQCNVDVSGIDLAYNSGAVPIKFNVTYEDMTDEYAVRGGRGA